MNLTTTIKKFFLPALFIIVLVVSVFKKSEYSLEESSQRIQSEIYAAEDFFSSSSQDTTFINDLFVCHLNGEYLKKYKQKNYLLFAYNKDSLVCWNSGDVDPNLAIYAFEQTGLLKLKNGWYFAQKHKVDSTRTILALLLIKHDFPFENKFLENKFAIVKDVPENVQLSELSLAGATTILNKAGEPLFSLFISGTSSVSAIDYWLLAAQLLLLVLYVYYLFRFSVKLIYRYSFLVGFVFFVVFVMASRAVMLYFDVPAELYKLDIFNPKYYASTLITKSLGDLIINCVLISCGVFFYNHYVPRAVYTKGKWVAIMTVGFTYLYLALFTWVFKTLVLDSVISFEVYNVFSLSGYSFAGFFCIVTLLMVHFILIQNNFDYWTKTDSFKKLIYGSLVFFAAILVILSTHTEYEDTLLFVILWNVVFIFVMYHFMYKGRQYTIEKILVYLAFYALLTTFLIENIYEKRERNQRRYFSENLITERDFIAEYMFDDVAKRIAEDGFIKSFLANPIIGKKEVVDRITALYMGGYFNKYDLKIHAFDQNDNLLRSDDTTLNDFLKIYSRDSLPKSKLVYYADSTENYAYFSVVDFNQDSTTIGSLLLHLTPKVYYGQNVFPELLLGSSVSVTNNTYQYDYAIYQNDKLVAQSGEFPYTYYWNKYYVFENDFEFIEEPEWEHSIQRFPNGKKVVVTVAREPMFEPVATFSYLFSFYFLFSMSLLILVRYGITNTVWDNLIGNFNLSFRTRINYSMLTMILLSFIIIGIVTISFFRKQYDSFYSDRLLRKEKVIHTSLEYLFQQNALQSDAKLFSVQDNLLKFEIARLAEINASDINLYDRNGLLRVSSQPTIYEKGLVSKRMNPYTYFDLENNKGARETVQEQIGNLNYLSTYAPIRNQQGEAVAYIGIPYFERNKEIDSEVSTFLVALMNVYVFILICAALLAYFVSNSITRPLTIISEKLRILNLNKKNEPIEWQSKDEIGVLVGEYNKMINELEQSARKLAKGERESAWREMAKQIAHEIKNPLTPMKLSIQYLQRAIDEGNPNIEQLARKVAVTLNEQIENLSAIATAFASFAKMPKAQNEFLQINDLLKSVADLFNKDEDATVLFNTEVNFATVYADKNQLISVFNNLVKNGIQSVPEGRKAFVEVLLVQDDGWFVISVKDNGVGIAEELKDKVFVPNFTTKSSGTGLGLAFTKQIVDGAGGTIWFEPNEVEGTTFFVRLRKMESSP